MRPALVTAGLRETPLPPAETASTKMSLDAGANKPCASPATQPETPEPKSRRPEPPQVSVTLSSRQRSYF
ncbi:hypothetical protein NDU88_002599 [Pleurodeles waltl]|uniref:Uncharacterized protein n=1 Tax=Pleurodeles waltl TaxID=8319 RepID=A0AAV7RF00_PLEWA|nr:hypothetical protein NDU88_002599 [Pleurodeles waltl]